MRKKAIGTKIHAYNVYLEGDKLLGVADEVTLPDLEAVTETLSGTGILGEIDEPLTGQYGSLEIEIPFRVMDQQVFRLLKRKKAVDITLRMSMQTLGQDDLLTDFMPNRVAIKGKVKGITGGSVKAGQAMNASAKIEIFYYMVEVNKKKMLELDKLNFKYAVDGIDMLEKVRKQV